MRAELRGSIPKFPFAFSGTLVNRAWKSIRLSSLWSFNMFESAWITPPPIIGTGTVTTTQGFPTITFDATAIAAINANQIANPYSLISQRQFRVAVGGIYSIISYNPSTGAAILDRIFADASGVGQAFQLYQLYYTAPYLDFQTWITVRNPQMFYTLDLNLTRAEIDDRDPQRTNYLFPTAVIPFGTDTRGYGTPTPSATLGYPMFELWGAPLQPFTYQCYGVRQGLDLVNPGDTLPAVVAEETVIALARQYAYEWAEANKAIAPRNQGPDFRFLIGQAASEYKRLLVRDRVKDREFISNFYIQRGARYQNGQWGFYNTLSGVASTVAGAGW